MVQSNIPVIDYKSGELDINTWLNVAKTSLWLMVAAAQSHLRKAAALEAHKIHKQTI